MKKLRITFILVLFVNSLIQAQIARFNPGDSENKTSILSQPNSVGVDISDEKLTADFNNLESQRGKKDKTIFGLQFQGGNSDKSTNIFKGGKFTLGSEMKAFLGYSFLIEPERTKVIKNKMDSLSQRILNIDFQRLASANQFFIQAWSRITNPLIERRVRHIIFDKPNRTQLAGNDLQKDLYIIARIGTWLGADPVPSMNWNPKMIEQINETGIASTDSIALFNVLQSLAQADFALSQGSSIIQDISEYQRLSKLRSTLINKVGLSRVTPYIRGSISGHSFTKLDTLISVISEDSLAFNKQEFRGGSIELGINIMSRGNVFIGASYLRRWTDNLADLESTSFSIKRTQVIGADTFDYSETENAFTNRYFRFQETVILFDGGWISEPFKDDKSRIMVHGYFRFNIPEETARNDFDKETREIFGLGANFFKKDEKFLVGLFSEFPMADFSEFAFGIRGNYTFNKLF